MRGGCTIRAGCANGGGSAPARTRTPSSTSDDGFSNSDRKRSLVVVVVVAAATAMGDIGKVVVVSLLILIRKVTEEGNVDFNIGGRRFG